MIRLLIKYTKDKLLFGYCSKVVYNKEISFFDEKDYLTLNSNFKAVFSYVNVVI